MGLIGDFLEHYFTNNANLKSEIRTLFYQYQSENFEFLSDNGVFSKNEVDTGSKLLVETMLEQIKEKNLNILDVGCGYGFLGVTLGKMLDSEILMIDVNKRAVHLAEQNRMNHKIRGRTICSNIYESVLEKYDVIVTNPPIRAGKKVVLDILIGAKEHLKKGGALWFVIRKDQGAKSIKKEVEKYGTCEILKKSKGFYILKAEFS